MMPIQELPGCYTLFTNGMTDEVLQRGFDIVVANRFVFGVPVTKFLEYKAKYGFGVVIDIDDYWHLDPWHILSATYPTQTIIDYIKIADVVTTTHTYLAKLIKPLNRNVEILPNALPFGRGQFHVERLPIESGGRVQPDAMRIVYAGSVTHERDIALMANPLKRIAGDWALKKKLHMIMCGYDPEGNVSAPVWQRMISDFLCGFKLNGHIRPPLPPDQYMAFYTEADCTVAPLVASKFNACKSNLKVLEAATKKIPIIVSNVPPYSDCPYAAKVDVQGDWYKKIKMFANDKKMREEIGEANHQWAVEHHHIDKVNITRKQIYESVKPK